MHTSAGSAHAAARPVAQQCTLPLARTQPGCDPRAGSEAGAKTTRSASGVHGVSLIYDDRGPCVQSRADCTDAVPEAARPVRRRRSRASICKTTLGAAGAAYLAAGGLVCNPAFASSAAAAPSGAPPGGGGGSSGQSGGGGGGGGGGSGAGGDGGWGPFRWFRKKKDGPAAVTLTLVSFAVSRKAYSRITKRFIKDYKERTGVDVGFRLSFAASGTQARAVIDGLPADIAALSLPLDIMKIADAGLMRKDWRKGAPNNAVVATSVVAIVVREGNPKNIRTWDDLVRDDVETITANPKTAGVARWNFLALWGAHMARGHQAALDYTKKVFEHVPIQPRDAREASDVFYKQKTGDALLTYENEVIMTNESQAPSRRLPYVTPQNNISIEFPIALIDRNLDLQPPEARVAAQAFVDYCFTPDAQREFAECGFRSINKEVAREFPLPRVKTQWTVEKKLGGWDAAQDRFFKDQSILDKIQREVGQHRVAERMSSKKSNGWFSWWP